MRHMLTLAALLGLGACSWFQDLRNPESCATAAGAEMRALDRQIAAAERDANGTFHGHLYTDSGKRGSHLCRAAGNGKLECAPVARGGKHAGNGAVEDPHARLAELRVQRQGVLRRMMRCES